MLCEEEIAGDHREPLCCREPVARRTSVFQVRLQCSRALTGPDGTAELPSPNLNKTKLARGVIVTKDQSRPRLTDFDFIWNCHSLSAYARNPIESMVVP